MGEGRRKARGVGANGERTDGGSSKPGETAVDPSEVFDRHRPLLFSIACRMLGSVMDAEDIVQTGSLGGVPARSDPGAADQRDGMRGRLMKRGWLRGGLLALAVSAITVGMWALPTPRSFYDDFPLPVRAWVSTLGPYNEHLVRDVGALNLALGVLLVMAAVVLERRLVQVSLVAYLAYAVPPHFIFHVTKGHAFPLGDNVANLVSLEIAVDR
jgi:hypothetical protein